jgi:hypothetical protein
VSGAAFYEYNRVQQLVPPASGFDWGGLVSAANPAGLSLELAVKGWRNGC